MAHWLLEYLPERQITDALEKSDGDEITSGKIESPESSAALAINAFGLFLNDPAILPPLPDAEGMGWPAVSVTIEQQVRFPWSGGRHPWLDAFIETSTHIIGIESKRYEPFRAKGPAKFQETYWRPVWGEKMKRFEKMRDDLAGGEMKYRMLDGAQLVKHAFGLRTEAVRRGKKAALLYLFSEPAQWADGREIRRKSYEAHRLEIASFSEQVSHDEVVFLSCSYEELLKTFRCSPEARVNEHADKVAEKFFP